ncbi:hypothetical protein SAMN03097699_0980 [Flavobacteriaceae bacterium MAR_2010_188]|nr:hypothetical protein SAMN03097699_0980 [Flavobacteriaceae bacterium MAR_2010_188]
MINGLIKALLVSTLLLVSCRVNGQSITFNKSKSIEQQQRLLVDSIITDHFNIRLTKSFTQTDKLKLKEVISFLDAVILSDEFKKKVINTDFRDSRRYYMRNYKGEKIQIQKKVSSNQIFEQIVNGDDALGKVRADCILDIYLELKSLDIRGGAKKGMISTNLENFRQESLTQIAGNLMHEYMHVLGYVHKVSRRKVRDRLDKKDVPDGVGQIIYNWKE